jgi:hypothetical protein
MRSAASKILLALSKLVYVALIAGFVALLFAAYRSDQRFWSPCVRQWRDGLGRVLEPAPPFARVFLDADVQWAGWPQFWLQWLVVIGGAVVAIGLHLMGASLAYYSDVVGQGVKKTLPGTGKDV